MTGTPEETPTNAFAPGGRRRHRRARVSRIGARRALVLAMAVPVASATLAGTSAFAADDSSPRPQGISVDDLAADDAQLVKNLDERLADERLGTDVSGVVLDADSDTALWDHNGSTALMPASNAKLATATTALTLLGANHEFTTKVVYGEGTLTLVAAVTAPSRARTWPSWPGPPPTGSGRRAAPTSRSGWTTACSPTRASPRAGTRATTPPRSRRSVPSSSTAPPSRTPRSTRARSSRRSSPHRASPSPARWAARRRSSPTYRWPSTSRRRCRTSSRRCSRPATTTSPRPCSA